MTLWVWIFLVLTSPQISLQAVGSWDERDGGFCEATRSNGLHDPLLYLLYPDAIVSKCILIPREQAIALGAKIRRTTSYVHF